MSTGWWWRGQRGRLPVTERPVKRLRVNHFIFPNGNQMTSFLFFSPFPPISLCLILKLFFFFLEVRHAQNSPTYVNYAGRFGKLHFTFPPCEMWPASAVEWSKQGGPSGGTADERKTDTHSCKATFVRTFNQLPFIFHSVVEPEPNS